MLLSKNNDNTDSKSSFLNNRQHRKMALFTLVSVFLFTLFLAYFAFALPQITFQPPTLSDNATTGSDWVFVNLTSSENLNQSLLEWGNNKESLFESTKSLYSNIVINEIIIS